MPERPPLNTKEDAQRELARIEALEAGTWAMDRSEAMYVLGRLVEVMGRR